MLNRDFSVPSRLLFLLAVLLAPVGGWANLPAPANQQPLEKRVRKFDEQNAGRRHAAFLPKKMAKRILEKRLKQTGSQNTDKKLSKLARAALYLFVGGLVVSLLASATGLVLIGYLASAAFLATVVLCVMVLLDDEQNKISRNLAKALLIVYGAMLL
ncbi:MAG: hypothetical protein ACR2K1_12225, partial [Saprospiraceae bacterium]